MSISTSSTSQLPMVSVVMITYNHERYILQAIESVFMQQVNFPLELIIADDHSSDNTPQVVQSFIDTHSTRHLIRYTYHTPNKGMSPNFAWALQQASGKYIALLEGDDFWTDPHKLQKQVDFLEQHDEFVLTAGGFTTHLEDQPIREEIYPPTERNKSDFDFGYPFDLVDITHRYLTKTLTLVFRTRCLTEVMKHIDQLHYFRDIHLTYLLMRQGKGFYFTTNFGTFNIHEGGVNSMKTTEAQYLSGYNSLRELFQIHKDYHTSYTLRRIIKGYIKVSVLNGHWRNVTVGVVRDLLKTMRK